MIQAQLQVVEIEEDQELAGKTTIIKMDWFEGRSLAAISGRQIKMAEDCP